MDEDRSFDRMKEKKGGAANPIESRSPETHQPTPMKVKTTMKTILYLPMTALLVTTAVAGPEPTREGLPFSGVIEGTEDFHPQDEGSGIDLNILGSGAGNASHLGPFTATWDGDITFANPDHPIQRTFVAANGDELYAEGPGAGTPPDPDQFVVETMTISGGTGRFAGARGSFTVKRWVYNVAPPFIDLETRGSFSGTILLSLPTTFLRGDCSGDGRVDIADVTCALDWLFTGGSEPGCLAAANTNGDGRVDIADPVSLLSFLFAAGPAPAAPFPDCGPGGLLADEGLGCAIPSDCQQ